MFFTNLRKQMRWVLIVLVVMFGGSLLYIGGPGFFGSGAEQEVFAQTVAEVNGQPITAAELQSVYRNNLAFYRQFFGQLQPAQTEEILYQSLDALIRNRLVMEAARKENTPVAQEAIEEEFNRIKSGFPSEQTFRDELRRAGLTERALRDMIREHLMAENFEETIRSQAQVTEEEIRASYEGVRARHILIRPRADEEVDEEGAWERARAEAERLRAELAAGADFAQLAAEWSDDAGSAAQGGDVGFINQDTPFVEEFKEAALRLDVGEVSEPVRTPFGWHIIEVTERRTADDDGFAEAREEIENRLREQRGEERFRQWLEEYRAGAEVVIHDPRLRAYEKASQGDLDGAVADYRLALDEDPFDPYLHVALARVLERMGRTDEALTELETAVDKGMNDPELQLILGMAYRDAGRTDDAARVIVAAAETADWDWNLQFTASQLLDEMGYVEEAQKASARLMAIMESWAEQQQQESSGMIEFAEEDWLDGFAAGEGGEGDNTPADAVETP